MYKAYVQSPFADFLSPVEMYLSKSDLFVFVFSCCEFTKVIM